MRFFQKQGSNEGNGSGLAGIAVLSAASLLTSCSAPPAGPATANLFSRGLDTALVRNDPPELLASKTELLKLLDARCETLCSIKKQVESAGRRYRSNTPFAGELIDEVINNLCIVANGVEQQCNEVKICSEQKRLIALHFETSKNLERDKALNDALTRLLAAPSQKERFQIIGELIGTSPYSDEIADRYAPAFRRNHAWQRPLLKPFLR